MDFDLMQVSQWNGDAASTAMSLSVFSVAIASSKIYCIRRTLVDIVLIVFVLRFAFQCGHDVHEVTRRSFGGQFVKVLSIGGVIVETVHHADVPVRGVRFIEDE